MMEMHVCKRDGTVLRSFALGDAGEMIIGRDDHCDIRINVPTISREHCAIEAHGGGLVLRDLDSTTGTFVAGERVERVLLLDGVEARIGPAVLRFTEDDA